LALLPLFIHATYGRPPAGRSDGGVLYLTVGDLHLVGDFTGGRIDDVEAVTTGVGQVASISCFLRTSCFPVLVIVID
jgi:hypothetical protein